jgi:membrane-associated phospholipid phosphatase
MAQAISPAQSIKQVVLPWWTWVAALIGIIAFIVTLRYAIAHPLYQWEIAWHETLANIPLPGWIGLLAVIFIIGSIILGPAIVVWSILVMSRRQWLTAVVWLVSLVPSFITYVMKVFIQRPCPSNDGLDVFAILHITFLERFAFFVPDVLHTSCFPSGHTATYLTVFGLAAHASAAERNTSIWRLVVFYSSLFLIATIGIAAIGLAKHQAIDVVGGYFLGVPCLVSLIQFYRIARQHDLAKPERAGGKE